MWHVDEGALHAYLDGALDEYPAAEARRVREHLEACGECGKRLAQERRVREEAQDILALASPRVEIPTLEELRAYVKAQSPPGTKTRVRLYRLSWAASVVLALGTGWLLRGGVPQTTASGERGFASDQGAASAPSEPAARRVAPPSTTVPPPPPPTDAPPAQDAVRALAANESRSELAERSDPTSPTGVGGVAPAAALADATDADAFLAADDTADDVVAANTQATAREPSATAAAPAAPTVAPPAAAVAPPAAADAARQDTALRGGVAVERAAEQRLRSAITRAPTATGLGAGAPAIGRAADAPVGASVESVESVEADADAEPVSLVVPGLEVLDVLRIGEETTFLGTRALQLLPTGDTLETAHLPPGVDPTVLPPLRSGWSELIQPRGSGWLVMRAPVPPTTLAELLQRLDGGR